MSYYYPIDGSFIQAVSLKFSTSTVAGADSGYLRFDNADASLVTKMYVSRFNLNGDDISVYLDEDISEGDNLRIQLANDRNVFFKFRVSSEPTPGPNHIEIPVTYLEHAGALPNNAKIGFIANMGLAGGSSSAGAVESVVGGNKISVDDTDPQNPVVNFNPTADIGGGTWSD